MLSKFDPANLKFEHRFFFETPYSPPIVINRTEGIRNTLFTFTFLYNFLYKYVCHNDDAAKYDDWFGWPLFFFPKNF